MQISHFNVTSITGFIVFRVFFLPSRRDGENVTNHLALMACPLFAPLLFELPPAIMIQMLTSARQELGDEFVQLLIEVL